MKKVSSTLAKFKPASSFSLSDDRLDTEPDSLPVFIILDGRKVQINEPILHIDTDDMFTKEINSGGMHAVQEQTELGQAMHNINEDEIQKGTKMSGIDMRARLGELESAAIHRVDTLVALKFLPQPILQFTRQKKRLSVSREGKGRGELVELVNGKRGGDIIGGSSMFDRFRGLMGGGQK